MNLYRVTFDDQDDYVEAKTFGEAITVWRAALKVDDDWVDDTTEPQSVELVADKPVMRPVAIALNGLVATANDMLRFGTHDGPCTNVNDDEFNRPSCTKHVEATEVRCAALRRALDTLEQARAVSS